MVSLEWAASLGRAIPENWFPEVLNMSEDKCRRCALRFPHGSMNLPKKAAPKKAAPKKKPAPKKED